MTEAINGVLVTLINFLFGPIMFMRVFWSWYHDDHSPAGCAVSQIWDGIP